jgi:hypothetical protein
LDFLRTFALALFEHRFERALRLLIASGAYEDEDTWRGHDVALILNGSWRSACAMSRH